MALYKTLGIGKYLRRRSRFRYLAKRGQFAALVKHRFRVFKVVDKFPVVFLECVRGLVDLA